MNKPEIVSTISADIDLKKIGLYHRAPCPFHEEDTPSFIVNRDRQRYHCFGCGADGDVVDFAQHYHGLDFKDALKHLGISNGSYKIDPRKEKEREAINKYKNWLDNYSDFLAVALRLLDKKKKWFRTIEEVEDYSWHYGKESLWEYHFDLILNKKDEELLTIYKQGGFNV